jgi:hypothetical protein
VDRTSELKADYEDMQGLIEKFQRRQTLRVETRPNHTWYLFEREGRDSWIEQYDPEMYEYMKFHWGAKGWAVTQIDIFRKGTEK